MSPGGEIPGPFPPGEGVDQREDTAWLTVLFQLQGVNVWRWKMAHRLVKTFDINKMEFCDNTDSDVRGVDI